MGRPRVISLFDRTGIMLQPWAEAGYTCETWDIEPALHDGLHHQLDLRLHSPSLDNVAFIAAFPPCDHLAVSGARWFKGKGLRKLADAIELFAIAAEICEATGAPYCIENPVSTISTYWRKPDYRFHPWWYTGWCRDNNYTKQTCLWTGGGFVMPEQYVDGSLGEPDDRIHKAAPGPNRAAFRSATPAGFARAVFEANERKSIIQSCSIAMNEGAK